MGDEFADNEKWMTLLRDYMIENHINHTFWCLNPNSGDTGGLMNSTFSSWDEEKYAMFEPSLWQTSETGKFIGLDHQTDVYKRQSSGRIAAKLLLIINPRPPLQLHCIGNQR